MASGNRLGEIQKSLIVLLLTFRAHEKTIENNMHKQSKCVNNSSQTTGLDTKQCLCSDLLTVIADMKLNYEILLSRVDALQSLANSQTACSQNDDEAVNFEIEFIEERSKNLKMESTMSLMAMKNDSEIEALKCKIKSLENKLEKCINEVNPLIIAEKPNTFQSLAYDATSQLRIVQPQSLESPIVPPHLTVVPSPPPSPLSSQDNKRKEDAKQTSSFLNKLPLISELGEINCMQADYLNDIQLLRNCPLH